MVDYYIARELFGAEVVNKTLAYGWLVVIIGLIVWVAYIILFGGKKK